MILNLILQLCASVDAAQRLVAALRLQRLTVPKLRRVGPKADGGYVLFDSPAKGLLSYGVGTNVDFEYELAPSGLKRKR